jgi:hypothetical protein
MTKAGFWYIALAVYALQAESKRRIKIIRFTKSISSQTLAIKIHRREKNKKVKMAQ